MKTTYGKYTIFSCFWEGNFSRVYMGRNNITGDLVVLKFMERKSYDKIQDLVHIETELRIADKVSHKNIVKYHEVIFTDDFIIIVMENLQEDTLFAFKQNAIYEQHISKYYRWGREILEGLSYLHKRGISHHDIKPENIGFDELMQVKIIDFGLAEDTTNYNKISECEKVCGTPFFLAPEVMNEKLYNGEKSDIWSFGVTFHYMMTGRLPFKKVSTNVYYNSKDPSKYIDIKCTGAARKIVEWAMQISPEKRPTADQLLNTTLFSEGEIIAIPIGSIRTKKEFKAATQKPKLLSLAPRFNHLAFIRKHLTFTSSRK